MKIYTLKIEDDGTGYICTSTNIIVAYLKPKEMQKVLSRKRMD